MRSLLITIIVTICVVIAEGMLFYSVTARESEQMIEKQFLLNPIGVVHKENERTTLLLNKDVEPALLGLDGFSHVWVFWWLGRNNTQKKRSILQVYPRGNRENPLTGVFACRAPVRPNLIALTLCRILSVKNNVVEIDRIDAFADTPILDLKPYIPSSDSAKASIPDWVENRKQAIDKNAGDCGEK
ncbi:MAG: tRNA (N6-threonylcarbamoyladenosine(37)-N6)-methyltransferase TrmO [Thermodesulfobacteriota bacterium]|nr:tRNA (N6-threonylcarbamoyladenosine(37)-N6)-methyltransferase TrmO [Thermodesulfobacteriota bacterium]